MAVPHPLRSSLVLTATELAQLRANIFDRKLRSATRAWARTLGDANNWHGYGPQPTNPDDVESDNWHETLYTPGFHDGNAAYTLAVASYRTQKHGYTVFKPFSYYGPLVNA